MKAKRLPRHPSSMSQISWESARENFKAKYVPRQPKDSERLLLVRRPQLGPYEFLEYASGDMISTSAWACVVTAAKGGFTRSGEGWKLWEQLVIVRRATDDDHVAVAAQRAEQESERQRVMDRMMMS